MTERFLGGGLSYFCKFFVFVYLYSKLTPTGSHINASPAIQIASHARVLDSSPLVFVFAFFEARGGIEVVHQGVPEQHR